MRPLPEQDYLRDCFDYDPATGVLTWKHRADRSARWNARYAGKPAGTVDRGRPSAERMQVIINNHPYRSARIIWKLVTGKDPVATIDHANGNAMDNRWGNLREATILEQTQNRRRTHNKYGFRGIFMDPSSKKRPWVAQIKINRKCVCLGHFATREEAHAAHQTMAIKHFGKFYAKPEAAL